MVMRKALKHVSAFKNIKMNWIFNKRRPRIN